MAIESGVPTVSAAKKPWFTFALLTTLTWGVWGAFIELPEKAGFPATLGYSVWSLTMIPCAAIALAKDGWRITRDGRSVFLGLAVGLLGAVGQIILFQALRLGPAYLIFPIISLYPVLTIVLSMKLLGERAAGKSRAGIAIALVAILLLSYQPPSPNTPPGYVWLLLSALVFIMWGVQAYVMKLATGTMSAESIFFYMTVGGLLVIPIAVMMTDFERPIEWGLRGPWLAAGIQLLNAIGALTLVYAVRWGKAIIVVPMTSLAPVITIILSLIINSVVPHGITIAGMVLASIAIYLMAE